MFELSEAKFEKLNGDGDLSKDPKWKASDSSYLWKKTAPLSKRRVEIHPKFEGKVTLSQIEKECEESMRKQLKENQHKKKLQFSFIGKRNDTEESSPLDQTELHRDKRCSKFLEENERPYRASEKGVMKNESDFKGNAKRWMVASQVQADDKNAQTNNATNKLTVNKNTQAPNKVIDNSTLVSNLDPQKSNQEIGNDKSLKPADSQNPSNMESVELGQQERENKVVMKEITDYEDRDLKLLKLLYEGLNSKDGGVNEVEPLIKTLKEIADKKIALNMITRNNITAKPVSMKVEEKVKSSGQLKCANELFTKIKEYKDKHQDKKLIYNHFGSSPLNPNLINPRKENLYPAISSLFSTQPRGVNPEIFSFTKNNCSVLSSSLPAEQSDSSNIALLPNMNSNITEKSMNDYAIFVQLIDKILGTISENNTETSELLHDLNRKLLGTSKELGSYKMLEDLVRQFGDSVAKIKGPHKITEGNNEHIEDLMRSAREIKNFRDKFVESRERNGGKREQSTQCSACKPPNKNWSKSDELRRLQKVATELKSKIDDLLQNLEGTMSDAEEEEEEEDEDDDDDDEGDDESLIRDSNSTSLASSISTGPRRNKVNEDPFESFKKFKTTADTKMDKRKFKEYEPKGRLNKIVGKKPITMSNRYKSFEDKSKSKYFKSKRDKRDDCEQYYDKYDIYNFKSSRRKSGDELDSGRHNLANGIQDYSYGSVYIDPIHTNQGNKEYPKSYKTSDNNFNVFKVANEFKKVHRDMIDKRMESSPRVSGFQKYLGNNHQLRGRDYDIKKRFDLPSKSKSGKMKINEMNIEEMRKEDLYDDSIVNDSEGHKRNNTDIPHWLDYNDSEIRGKNPNMVPYVKKKIFKDLNNFNRNFDSSSSYRERRSLLNLFDYFKSNKDTVDDKMTNKAVAKEIKINGTTINSKVSTIKDPSTALLETTGSAKAKAQFEPVIVTPAADPQPNTLSDYIIS